MDVTIVAHVFPTLIKSWDVSVCAALPSWSLWASWPWDLAPLLQEACPIREDASPERQRCYLRRGHCAWGTSGDFTEFAAWRILACLGMGAAMASGNTQLADLVPEGRRAALLAAASAGVRLGTTLGAILAGTLIPTAGWRVLLVIAGMIPLAAIAMVTAMVPESSAFLAARRRVGGTVFRAGQGLRVRPSAPGVSVGGILARPLAPTTLSRQRFGCSVLPLRRLHAKGPVEDPTNSWSSTGLSAAAMRQDLA